MHILAIGINYKTAPVEIREKFTFAEDEVSQVLKKLRAMNSMMECSLIATCNRTEFYCVVDHVHCGEQIVMVFLQDYFGIDRSEFRSYIYSYAGGDAVMHLFRVACGLDSMVLGETQILGQVRKTYEIALRSNAMGTILKHLFPHAVSVGKRCHTETDIGKNAVSISYAAIELAKKIFGSLEEKQVLILGAGKMSELTARHLDSSGVKKIMVANRTWARAQELAEKFFGQAVAWQELETALCETDIVVSSTAATDYVLTHEIMQKVMFKRKYKPIFLIDIAVPRDLDPRINDIDNAFLYDIDELEDVVEANKKLRAKEVDLINVIIEHEFNLFCEWISTLEVIPLIKALKYKTDDIYDNTMQSLYNKLPDLSEREQKLIRKHTRSIINQILKEPITYAKEVTGERKNKEQIKLIAEIFGVKNEMHKQKVVSCPLKKMSTNKEELYNG